MIWGIRCFSSIRIAPFQFMLRTFLFLGKEIVLFSILLARSTIPSYSILEMEDIGTGLGCCQQAILTCFLPLLTCPGISALILYPMRMTADPLIDSLKSEGQSRLNLPKVTVPEQAAQLTLP